MNNGRCFVLSLATVVLDPSCRRGSAASDVGRQPLYIKLKATTRGRRRASGAGFVLSFAPLSWASRPKASLMLFA